MFKTWFDKKKKDDLSFKIPILSIRYWRKLVTESWVRYSKHIAFWTVRWTWVSWRAPCTYSDVCNKVVWRFIESGCARVLCWSKPSQINESNTFNVTSIPQSNHSKKIRRVGVTWKVKLNSNLPTGCLHHPVINKIALNIPPSTFNDDMVGWFRYEQWFRCRLAARHAPVDRLRLPTCWNRFRILHALLSLALRPKMLVAR